MNSFVTICVYIVVYLLVMIITGLIGLVMNKVGSDDGSTCVYAWIMSSFGFTYCLVELLIEYGVLS